MFWLRMRATKSTVKTWDHDELHKYMYLQMTSGHRMLKHNLYTNVKKKYKKPRSGN